MPIITPTWLMNFESRMQLINETEHLELVAGPNTWWDSVARVRPSASGREFVSWFLNLATLEDQGQGGNMEFDDPQMLITDYTSKTSGKGLRLRRQQVEDLDGNGVDAATEWSAQMGSQFGYWPQRQVSTLIKAGEDVGAESYDGVPFFYDAHPLDGDAGDTGTFANLLIDDGSADNAFRIDDGVTDDQAMKNLARVYKRIRSIKMPNGKDPRMLRPAGVFAGPALFPTVAKRLDAKFLAATGGGTSDFTAYASRLGYGSVTEMPEMIEDEYETSYFVVVELARRSQLGAIVYVDREPYNIRYYTGRGGGQGVDAILGRTDQLEWQSSGRNVAGYGHPFLIFKIKKSP